MAGFVDLRSLLDCSVVLPEDEHRIRVFRKLRLQSKRGTGLIHKGRSRAGSVE